MYTLHVSKKDWADDFIRCVATDKRIRTVSGFRRAYPEALGLQYRRRMDSIYAYAEVQRGTPDDYEIVDSWSA